MVGFGVRQPRLAIAHTVFYGESAQAFLDALGQRLPKRVIVGCNAYRAIGARDAHPRRV